MKTIELYFNHIVNNICELDLAKLLPFTTKDEAYKMEFELDTILWLTFISTIIAEMPEDFYMTSINVDFMCEKVKLEIWMDKE